MCQHFTLILKNIIDRDSCKLYCCNLNCKNVTENLHKKLMKKFQKIFIEKIEKKNRDKKPQRKTFLILAEF